MACQPRVFMHMRDTKYCTVEVTSKQTLFYRLNRKTIALDISEAFYTL